MDASTAGVIAAPIGTAVVAFFGWLATRNTQAIRDVDRLEESTEELREDRDEQRTRADVALSHIYELRQDLRDAGAQIRALPPELQSRPRRPQKKPRTSRVPARAISIDNQEQEDAERDDPERGDQAVNS